MKDSGRAAVLWCMRAGRERKGKERKGKERKGKQKERRSDTHGVDVRHDVLALDDNGPLGAVSQRNVQHGAVFGEVDLLASGRGKMRGVV